MKVLTEMTRDGAEKYMEAQKKLVDLAIKEMREDRKRHGRSQRSGAETRVEVVGRTDGEERTQPGEDGEVAAGPGHETPEGDGKDQPRLADAPQEGTRPREEPRLPFRPDPRARGRGM